MTSQWMAQFRLHKTDSYSPKLIEFSCYYRTFANVVTVRTIEAEYLIAMKLRAEGSTNTTCQT